MTDDDTETRDDGPWIWGQPEDYVNLRLLVDAAEHGRDHTALHRIRVYVDALEQIGDMRATARNTLPIPPLRLADCLPDISTHRGGIRYYLGFDHSSEAERTKARHDAVVALFKAINTLQWGRAVLDVTLSDLIAIRDRINVALDHLPEDPA